MMLVDSDALGTIEVPDDRLLVLPDGLLGLEDARQFALIPADDMGVYSFLQSVDRPELTFLTIVPAFFFEAYEPEIADEDVAALDLRSPDDAQVLCLVTIDDQLVTANLLGPVVVNTRTGTGRQVVLHDQGWSTKEQLGMN